MHGESSTMTMSSRSRVRIPPCYTEYPRYAERPCVMEPLGAERSDSRRARGYGSLGMVAWSPTAFEGEGPCSHVIHDMLCHFWQVLGRDCHALIKAR
jgi:hypothetical protein